MEIISDFQTTVRKSLSEIDSKYETYDGLVICGSHSLKDWEKQLPLVRTYREAKRPILGICWGMQLLAIEYARNVVGFATATTEEGASTGTFVVKKIPQLRVGLRKVDGWWGTTFESHWHHYVVDPNIVNSWEKSFAADGVLEIMRSPDAPFIVGVQFHPEYQSSVDKPHPLLVEFLNICRT